MKIRPATSDDFPAISEVTSACYRAMAASEKYTAVELAGLLTECASLESIRRQYSAFTAFVAEQAGEIVGVIGTEGSEIAQLFVAPRLQNQGIGRQLLAAAESHLKAQGQLKVWVYTATAPTYYQRIGYAVTEQRHCTDGPLKGRPLVFLEKPI